MSEPELGKGAAGTRKRREGLESWRSQKGSMKEGCVREPVKGGVCESHTETEKRHWHPVYTRIVYPACQSGQLPSRQSECLSCWSPPNTLSPSPLFGGEKSPVAIAEKGSKRKWGQLVQPWHGAFLPCTLTSFGAPGPPPGLPTPDLGAAAEQSQEEEQQHQGKPLSVPRGKHQAWERREASLWWWKEGKPC